MLRLLKKLRRNERGNILILTAATIPLLVGSAGLAVDTIQWTLWKRQLQRAADSAAMAGVYERTAQASASAVPNAVQRDVLLTQQTGLALVDAIPNSCPAAATTGSEPVLLCPPDATVGSVQRRNQVRVMLKVTKRLSFSSMFMANAPTIVARATAATVGGGGQYCVIGLDTRANKTAITIGGSTTVDMGTCSLISNSAHPSESATNVGESANGIVRAASIDAVGGVSYSRRWTVGSYNPGTQAVRDPFGVGSPRELSPPPQSSCTTPISGNLNNVNRAAADAPVDGVRKTVCMNNGMSISGNVTLGAATYVINAGDLTMQNGSLSCSGCTIILTNYADPTNTGNLKITGGTLTLTPPTEGTYRGVTIFQDRRAEDDDSNSPENRINGNANSNIQGVVYTPNRSISMLGGGTAAAPVCMQLIGKRVTFTGNSYIQVSSLCGASGLDEIEAQPVVRLVA